MPPREDFEPKILGFLCNWCCYAGADLAGVSRLQYPSNIRIIRVPCSGRIDPAFILRAFANGVDGVFMGGCHLGDCHYITTGNYYALSVMYLTKRILAEIGLDPRRLRLEWVSASEGLRFQEVQTDFAREMKEVGPLGEAEGIDSGLLKIKLEAARNLIPYIKLLERKRLRVRFETQEEYERYFTGEEFNRLFRELISEKLVMGQIMLLLREKSLSAHEISQILGINLPDVSKYLANATREGLVAFDVNEKRYSPAKLAEPVRK